MEQMMATYFSITRNTARQLWRRRAFWIVQGLLFIVPILFAVLMFLTSPGMPSGMEMSVPGLTFLALNYLLLPVLVSPLILDDLGKLGEILWSSPLDSLVHFAGLFSGLWVGLLVGSLLQLGGWFLANLFWTNMLSEWTWLLSLAIYLLVNTLGLSLTFLLALLIKRSLPLLLTWFVLWMWIFFSVVFGETLTEGFNPFSTTAYSNIFFHNLMLSSSMGLGLVRDQVIGMFAWFLGLSLLALSLALLLAPRVDARRSTRLNWFAPLVAGLSLLVAVGGYLMNRNAIEAHAIPPSPRSVQIDAWEVLSQRTLVEIDAARGAISGSSALQLSPQLAIDQPEIVLRLNAGLELTEASDESGQELNFHQLGDSIVISLAEVPRAPALLNLAWEGQLQIPYTAYDQNWRHYDAPYPYGFTHMPQPLKAFIQPAGGYLLRDGDWMPWPWSSAPHQARENHLTMRAQGGEAVASVPIQNGQAVWQGPLPQGLLAFLPAKKIEVGNMTLAASPLASQQHLQQAGLFAEAATRLASLFNAPLPRYVVVVPYLSELVWSGDLLLVPDGSGYYLSKPLDWLYTADLTGQQRPILERASMATLARTYLLGQTPPPQLEFQPRLAPSGGTPEVVEIASVSEQEWQNDNGHWVQAAEAFDVITTWDPRRHVELSPQGEWSTVAFWLAMELADEDTRQADLDLITYFAGEGQSIHSGSQRYELMYGLSWPTVLDTDAGRAMVQDLHQWALNLGSEDAISMLAAVIREAQPETVKELIVELEGRSGSTILKEQP
jgi:hypothetical protein